ncbi:unnamed protein product, partial [Symbiodinium natans]
MPSTSASVSAPASAPAVVKVRTPRRSLQTTPCAAAASAASAKTAPGPPRVAGIQRLRELRPKQLDFTAVTSTQADDEVPTPRRAPSSDGGSSRGLEPCRNQGASVVSVRHDRFHLSLGFLGNDAAFLRHQSNSSHQRAQAAA